MSGEVYEVLSLGMRYWFVFLGVMIVLRAFIWLMKDRRARHQRLRQVPDAGLIGELAVLRGSDELPEGMLIPMPYEGTLGFVRTADVVVPVDGVAGQHLDFSFQPHVGLLVYPRRRRRCEVDGFAITGSRSARRTPMVHGSVLTVGDAQLQLRLFAGLDTMPHRAPKPRAQQTLFGQPVCYDAPAAPEETHHDTLFGEPVCYEAEPEMEPDTPLPPPKRRRRGDRHEA